METKPLEKDGCVKKLMDAESTFFKSSPETNFIYQVEFPDGVKVDCENTFSSKDNVDGNNIATRIKGIIEQGGTIFFDHIQSEHLYQNLRLIDGDLPEILAYSLLYVYTKDLPSWAGIITALNENNPLAYRIYHYVSVYESKIVRFLQESALGMGQSPDKPWNGAIPIEKDIMIELTNGESLYFPVYELNSFNQYLLESTRLEHSSTGEDGWLYKEDDKYYFKINLQVRFKGISRRGG